MKKIYTILAGLLTATTLSAQDYTEWTSMGTATFESGYYLGSVEATLNMYRNNPDDEPEIKFERTSEVMERSLMADPSVKQFKICKFLGYDDIVLNMDAAYNLSTEGAPVVSSIPCPTGIAAIFSCDKVGVFVNGAYSPARKVMNLSAWVVFGQELNSGFNASDIIATFPDSKPEINFEISKIGGGYSSTDKSVTLNIEGTGIDHYRYGVLYTDRWTTAGINDLISGAIESATTSSSFTVEYTEGGGLYNVVVLAYDANNEYMGIRRSVQLTSNLPTPGTWEDAGTAVWHHQDAPAYSYWDYHDSNNSEDWEMISYEYPAEQLTWTVKLEKLADPTREVYRVVNPYGADCPLNESFNFLLDKMFIGEEAQNRPQAYFTDDTYWFVVDVTDPSNVTCETWRRNGHATPYFMSRYFDSYGALTMEGRTVKVTLKNIGDGTLLELPEKDGIESVEVDTTGASAEYYDLQGRRVSNPSAGVFIRRTGSSARKVRVL